MEKTFSGAKTQAERNTAAVSEEQRVVLGASAVILRASAMILEKPSVMLREATVMPIASAMGLKALTLPARLHFVHPRRREAVPVHETTCKSVRRVKTTSLKFGTLQSIFRTTTVRLRIPVNTVDFACRSIRMTTVVGKAPVEWAFSRTASGSKSVESCKDSDPDADVS